MSACVEWEVPFTLRSSYGDLDLNDDSGSAYYLLVDAGCVARRTLRVTSDPIPQGDGQIHHRRFTDGYEISLRIQMWETKTERACGQVLREMVETLMLHVNDMLNTPGRVLWTPDGLGDRRMLDQARVFAVGDPTRDGPGGPLEVTVGFDSPFPYCIDATEQDVVLVAGVPQNVTNDGNVPMFPVFVVNGPTSGFTIANNLTGEDLVYDSSLPGAVAIGGGDYVEFDFFRNTAYLNGSGANRKAGIDLELSDFWAIDAAVATSVEITGAGGTLKFNNAVA